MFVSVDPSENERQKNLRRAKIKSYATTLVHQKRSHKILRQATPVAKTSDDGLGPGSGAQNVALRGSGKKDTGALQLRWVLETTSSDRTAFDETATAQQNRFIARQDSDSPIPAPLNPPAVHGGDLTPSETRAIHFFQHRTAQEWCNWGEMRLMMQYVPQASVQIPALRHAMISLGAYHQFLEQRPSVHTNDARNVALINATKTLTQFRTDHGLLTIGTILMAQIVLTLTTTTLNDAGRFRAEYLQYELFDSVKQMVKQKSSLISKADLHLLTTLLIPLIDRQDSKEGLYVDAICCLQNTKAPEFQSRRIPPTLFSFDRIEQAYAVAEILLENAAYIQKTNPAPAGTLPEQCRRQLWLWKDALDRFAYSRTFDRQDQLTISILNVAVNFGAMMVAVMNSKEEMVFDEYNHLYDSLNTVLRASHNFAQDCSTVNVTFGLSAGLLALASNSVLRWCRDPSLRSKLIQTMADIHRCEGIEGSLVWAYVAKAVQHAEESGVVPAPTSSADIPESRRLIVNAISLYASSGLLKLELWRDPWNKRTAEEICIPWEGTEDVVVEQLAPVAKQKQKTELPLFVMGRGYASRLDQTSGKKYQTRCPRFYFPLPRR